MSVVGLCLGRRMPSYSAREACKNNALSDFRSDQKHAHCHRTVPDRLTLGGPRGRFVTLWCLPTRLRRLCLFLFFLSNRVKDQRFLVTNAVQPGCIWSSPGAFVLCLEKPLPSTRKSSDDRQWLPDSSPLGTNTDAPFPQLNCVSVILPGTWDKHARACLGWQWWYLGLLRLRWKLLSS